MSSSDGLIGNAVSTYELPGTTIYHYTVPGKLLVIVVVITCPSTSQDSIDSSAGWTHDSISICRSDSG